MCETCKITLSRKTNRGKKPAADIPTTPGRMVMADLQRNPFPIGLLVDVASTYPVLLGTNTITTKEVLRLLKVYRTMLKPDVDIETALTFDASPLVRFQADAGELNLPEATE